MKLPKALEYARQKKRHPLPSEDIVVNQALEIPLPDDGELSVRPGIRNRQCDVDRHRMKHQETEEGAPSYPDADTLWSPFQSYAL